MRASLYLPLILIFSLSLTTIWAQDIHFTQYYNSPMNINPALTGIFKGDVRYGVNYRRQWATVPVPYNTVSFAFDQKLTNVKLPDGQLAIGGLFNYDQSGDTRLTWIKLELSGSYTHILNPSNLITGGIQLSAAQRSFDMTDMTFHNQFDGEVFNPGLDPREDFMNDNHFIFKVNAGINYRWQQDSRTKVDIGVGLMNINSPEHTFIAGNDVELASRLNFFGQGTFKLNETLDIVAAGMVQIQGEYQEFLISPAIKHYLSQERGNELAIQIGIDYRLKDAIAPVIQIYYNQWQVGLSYDINNSDFTEATDSNGGPEIYLRYVITKVKPMDFKICPIY